MTLSASRNPNIEDPDGPADTEALEELVLGEFRRALLMTDADELELDVSFFDMGLTSLRLMDIKRSLEQALALEIDATALFNQPTIEQLVAYLGSCAEARI